MYDITKVLQSYVIPDGSIVVFSEVTGQWDTIPNYDYIPVWATHTCEIEDGKIVEIMEL